VAQRLRRAGISARTDVMGERKMTRQLKHADSLRIPYAIIVGRAEIEKAVLRLKFMEKREEKEMKIEEIIKLLKNKLS
jgi:histidyl-tRNA synthetase